MAIHYCAAERKKEGRCYEQKAVKWDSDSDSDETDQEDLKV